ncbi:hypothetical protein Salat_2694000 [Sesamum alatum]|uniref:Uncharacterized protein n=1 Tax=Sesamum alatum TaxID=300844 RepID=A0AAE2CBC8_9LAMI|nr:hypothetical protein Salat_2694000 [Sesamum alatum]
MVLDGDMHSMEELVSLKERGYDKVKQSIVDDSSQGAPMNASPVQAIAATSVTKHVAPPIRVVAFSHPSSPSISPDAIPHAEGLHAQHGVHGAARPSRAHRSQFQAHGLFIGNVELQ